MNAGKVDATLLNDTGITWTLLATLYLRAWESRQERHILGDHYAAAALDRIDYDFSSFKRKLQPQGNQYLVALRARQLDEWSINFLALHPDATVLQLGCGLDSRMLRLAPPAPARWFDVDIPKVIDVRRQLYPERDGYQTIGSSVTDPDWLDQVPADRPVLVVAEGLLMYLKEDEVRDLLQRLTDRFDSGQLIFDGIAPWLVRLSKIGHWGVGDGHQLEKWNPRLHLVEQVSFGSRYDLIPSRFYRGVYRLGDAIGPWRRMFREYRFTF